MKRAVFAFVLASALAPQLAADARFQPEPPFTLPHGSPWYSGVHVVADGGGGYVAAWRDHSTPTILAQHFDAHGIPRAAPFVVRALAPPYAYIWGEAIVADGSGRFAVTFTEASWAPERAVVGFCLFDASDRRLRCEYEYASAGNGVNSAALAFGPTGLLILGWGEYDSAYDLRVRARIYEYDGTPRGPAFVIDTGATEAYGPSVTHAGPGAFRVAWETQDAAGWHTLVRRYDTWGAALDEPVAVLAAPACTDAAGNFVGVWHGLDEQEMSAIFVQLYDAVGQSRTSILQVNQATHDAYEMSTACDAAGDFVVTWGAEDHVFARRFTGTGVPDSPEFRVDRNNTPSYYTELTALTCERNGNFTIFVEGADADSPDLAQPYRVQPPPRVKGDFDDDGHADLVLRRINDGSVRVWALHEGVRTGNLPLWPSSPDPDWQIEGAADFNADGHADLLTRQPLTGNVLVWLLGGASGVEVLGQAPFTGAVLPAATWEVAATADFDRDGKPDLLWRDSTTAQLMVWLLDGTRWRATVLPNPDHAIDANWKVVAAGDLDGDGWTDLLWYNTSSGRVVQWLLDAELVRSAGRFTDPPQPGDANWQVLAAGDYGFGARAQAGTYDLVWRNVTAGKLVVWLMDNAGRRTEGRFLTPSAPSDALAWTVTGPR